MIKHELKILPEYFCQVKAGLKTFEIRENDRDYQVGDLLELKEWNDGKFTGDSVLVQVTYITDYAQKDSYVVMGIKSPRADSVVSAENERLEETMAIIRENERLRTQVGTDFFRYGEFTTAYEEVAEENARLREALKFYADEENYEWHEINDLETVPGDILNDNGKKARQVLGGDKCS